MRQKKDCQVCSFSGSFVYDLPALKSKTYLSPADLRYSECEGSAQFV